MTRQARSLQVSDVGRLLCDSKSNPCAAVVCGIDFAVVYSRCFTTRRPYSTWVVQNKG